MGQSETKKGFQDDGLEGKRHKTTTLIWTTVSELVVLPGLKRGYPGANTAKYKSEVDAATGREGADNVRRIHTSAASSQEDEQRQGPKH